MLGAINDVNFLYSSIRQEKIKMQKRRKFERGNYQGTVLYVDIQVDTGAVIPVFLD